MGGRVGVASEGRKQVLCRVKNLTLWWPNQVEGQDRLIEGSEIWPFDGREIILQKYVFYKERSK